MATCIQVNTAGETYGKRSYFVMVTATQSGADWDRLPTTTLCLCTHGFFLQRAGAEAVKVMVSPFVSHRSFHLRSEWKMLRGQERYRRKPEQRVMELQDANDIAYFHSLDIVPWTRDFCRGVGRQHGAAGMVHSLRMTF